MGRVEIESATGKSIIMSRYDFIEIEKLYNGWGIIGGKQARLHESGDDVYMTCKIERRFLSLYKKQGWRERMTEYEEWGY